MKIRTNKNLAVDTFPDWSEKKKFVKYAQQKWSVDKNNMNSVVKAIIVIVNVILAVVRNYLASV